MTAPELFLHEEILLLALCDERGTIESGAWYQQAVGAAVVAELLLAERVAVVPSGKRPKLRVLRADPVGDPLVDEWLGVLASEKKPRTLSHWVSKVSGTKGLKKRIAGRLARRGVLEEREGKLLLVFPRTTWPERDAGPEREIRQRLETAIFEDVAEVDPRTTALVSIARSSGILSVVFPKRELKARKRRIDRIVAGELAGPAAAELIQSVQTAILVAAIIPAVTST